MTATLTPIFLAILLVLPGSLRPAETSARFDPGRAPELEVRRLSTGHLLVHPRVNGADVGWFLLDSGSGSNVLGDGLAVAHHMRPVGKGIHRGVSGEEVEFIAWQGASLALGPLTLVDPVFVGLDLSFVSRQLGQPIVGILGFDLFQHAVVCYEQATPAVALFDPAAFELEEGQWQGMLMHERIPCVQADFEGRRGRFRLDTGAPQDTVTFHSPAVERHGLLQGRRTRKRRISGFAGFLELEEGTLESFDLAGMRFVDFPAGFAREGIGALANPHTDGNIGGRLLEPFRVIFDYRHRRIAFVSLGER